MNINLNLKRVNNKIDDLLIFNTYLWTLKIGLKNNNLFDGLSSWKYKFEGN